MSEVVFGRVQAPPIEELICPKPYEGAGFYRVAPRQNVGTCDHITAGRGSIDFYHRFFSTGGERATDALVDFVVDRSGRIGMLNDWRGTRAPWANGNKLGMEGDGPAFYQRFGVEGIDQKLVSIEHEGTATEDWTPELWKSAVWLEAWLFDQMGVRHDSFPVNQHYGVVTAMFHSEFTNKGGNELGECPGVFLKQHVNEFHTDIRAMMKTAQTVVVPVPPDPPQPPVDTAATPPDWFEHYKTVKSDKRDGTLFYQYLERRFKVAKGRKSQKRVDTSKDSLIVTVLEPDTQIMSAFVARIDNLDWLIDQNGYAYQLNALSPKVSLPLKPRP